MSDTPVPMAKSGLETADDFLATANDDARHTLLRLEVLEATLSKMLSPTDEAAGPSERPRADREVTLLKVLERWKVVNKGAVQAGGGFTGQSLGEQGFDVGPQIEEDYALTETVLNMLVDMDLQCPETVQRLWQTMDGAPKIMIELLRDLMVRSAVRRRPALYHLAPAPPRPAPPRPACSLPAPPRPAPPRPAAPRRAPPPPPRPARPAPTPNPPPPPLPPH